MLSVQASACTHTLTHTHTQDTHTHPTSGSESQSLGARGCSSAGPCLPFYDSTKRRGWGRALSPQNKSLCKLEVPAGFRVGGLRSPFPGFPPPVPEEGLLSAYLGGQTPARAGLETQAYSPPDHARTSQH